MSLPADVPASIVDTARDVTASAPTDYDKALALQEFLRNGDFRYSETAPVADDYDGNGLDVVATFLERKAGYCVHFASAMAVMARTIDIPSRIAVGYAPGRVTGIKDGETVYANTSDDLHAWTELFFEGAGWVRFDPTTSIGTATAFEEPASATPDESVRGDQRTDERTASGTRARTPAAEASTSSRTAPRTFAVTGAIVLVILAAPGCRARDPPPTSAQVRLARAAVARAGGRRARPRAGRSGHRHAARVRRTAGRPSRGRPRDARAAPAPGRARPLRASVRRPVPTPAASATPWR